VDDFVSAIRDLKVRTLYGYSFKKYVKPEADDEGHDIPEDRAEEIFFWMTMTSRSSVNKRRHAKALVVYQTWLRWHTNTIPPPS
jgi:hypothetical protein